MSNESIAELSANPTLRMENFLNCALKQLSGGSEPKRHPPYCQRRSTGKSLRRQALRVEPYPYSKLDPVIELYFY